MNKLKYLFSLFFIGAFSLQAQDTAYLDIGNVRALVNSNGALFYNSYRSSPSYEVPKGSNKFTIYSSSFWMMNKKLLNNKEIHSGAFELYGMNNIFNLGPVDIINGKDDTTSLFERVWKVSKADIDFHKQNWNQSNYNAPNSILDWPGNGNGNISQKLAPFSDIDNDGIYEPNNGEYPIIKGDQAVFFMLNDYRPPLTVVDSFSYLPGADTLVFQSANLEVHAMIFVDTNQTEHINNTVFANIKIINRSTSPAGDLNDFRVSVWTDFDIGNIFDDYIGTDTSRRMVYGYNGDLIDENYGSTVGYGTHLAAQGVKFLNSRLFSSLYHTNSMDVNGSPSIFIHHSNYQRSIWKNGTPVYFGGNGYNYCIDTNQITNYMYSGDPTLVSDTTQWTESNICLSANSLPNPPDDRRMLGTADLPNQLLHGDTLVMDYAYVFAMDTDSSTYNADPLEELFMAANNVQAFYDSLVVTGIEEKIIKNQTFNLFPNPSNHLVNIETEAKEFTLSVYDINGRKIKDLSNKKQFSVEVLNNGIYLIQLVTEGTVVSRKLVVQH